MQHRALFALLLGSALALTACDSSSSTGTAGNSNNATVRFVNATGASLDIASNGTVSAGNSALSFGLFSSCMSVDPAGANLTVRMTGTSTALPGFTPSIQSGGNFTVIAFPGVGGTTQFATVSNAFTATSGQVGLRIFNAAASGSSFDVFVTTPGAALGTPGANNIGFGTGSSYFNVAGGVAQQIRITNAGSQTVVLDAGSMTFAPGQNATLVLAPAITSSAPIRSFVVPGC
jgi:hypothetical protein